VRKLTKKERAIELYKKVYLLPTDQVVRNFIKELDLPSDNSARTYISLSKKVLAPTLKVKYNKRKRDNGKSKRSKAIELFNNNQQLTRKEIIELFVQELGMTEASAATHCSLCTSDMKNK
jgi:uncharacterized protein YneR